MPLAAKGAGASFDQPEFLLRRWRDHRAAAALLAKCSPQLDLED